LAEKMQRQKQSAAKRKRRSTQEVIDRILDEAGKLFEKNGYERTTTAEIARNADVAEPLIFKHFTSKNKLFHDAIFKPLDRLFNEFITTHHVGPEDSETREIYSRQYIVEVQKFIAEHSSMLKSLVVTQMYGPENVHGVGQVESLHSYLEHAASAAVENLSGKPKVDPRLIARVSFATQLACVIFRDWLFPEDLGDENIINKAIAHFVMEGVATNARYEKETNNQF